VLGASSSPILMLSLWLLAACNGGKVNDLERRTAALEIRVAKIENERRLDAAKPNPAENCAKAKVAAHDAWERPLAISSLRSKQARERAAATYNRSITTHPVDVSLLDASIAANQAVAQAAQTNASILGAQQASSGGALKFRDAVQKVKDDSTNPEIATARAASGLAFDACKDLEP
jgi:hypothetical protein